MMGWNVFRSRGRARVVQRRLLQMFLGAKLAQASQNLDRHPALRMDDCPW